MKKYFFGLLTSLLLFGGIGSAEVEPPLVLDPVGFTADGEALDEIGEYFYEFIPDGDPARVYGIRFSEETRTTLEPEELVEIGLCLDNGETLFPALEKYYIDRETPEPYFGYLLSAAAGEVPFAVVQIKAGEEEGDLAVVTLCDGAILGEDLECVPMRIPGDYPYGIYPVSSCLEGNPPLAFTLVIGTDEDGDGVFDDVDICPNSDPTAEQDGKLVIGSCNSGVPNTLINDGCAISDGIAECAEGAENHGEFVSCVTDFTNGLKASLLTGAQKGAIQSCAARSTIGGPCFEAGCEEEAGLGQNRHRARYELAENDLVIPCVEIGHGQYFAVDMDLTSAISNNFHFKVKKAEVVSRTEMAGIENPEGTCAQYDLLSNSLVFPSLEVGEKQWRVQMKLLGANSVNLHFKLQAITEVEVE